MNRFSGLTMGLCAFLLAGCASQGKVAEVAESNQKILRDNESRLSSLEDSVTALNTQIAQLNNRVYEVRTSNGQKTTMRVVPITGQPSPSEKAAPAGRPVPAPHAATPAPQAESSAPAAGPAATPAVEPAPARAAQPAAPKGRKINPAAQPAALAAQAPKTPPAPARAAAARATPARAAASGAIGHPEPMAGPSGQISSQPDEIALPPSDLPGQRGDVGTTFTGQANNRAVTPPSDREHPEVPVPVIPVSDLSLPPEHPAIAPEIQQTAPTPAPAANAPKSATPARAAAPSRGEEAAYKAALNAARSGRTAEGIRLFRNFLKEYPNGRYTANADYWIGECLYAEGKYKDALSQFQTVNSSFPSHHKNADALLKAALTLNRMGDKAGAQEKFRTLLANFPNSDAARRARAMGASH